MVRGVLNAIRSGLVNAAVGTLVVLVGALYGALVGAFLAAVAFPVVGVTAVVISSRTGRYIDSEATAFTWSVGRSPWAPSSGCLPASGAPPGRPSQAKGRSRAADGGFPRQGFSHAGHTTDDPSRGHV